MSAALIISTHLNVPYGKIVSDQDVIKSIKNGCFSADSPIANDILSALFIEVSFDLIMRCSKEVGGSQESLIQLYTQSVALTGIRLSDWEILSK
jgi:hypothetical protein